MIPEMHEKDLSYESHLLERGLTTLETRRLLNYINFVIK